MARTWMWIWGLLRAFGGGCPSRPPEPGGGAPGVGSAFFGVGADGIERRLRVQTGLLPFVQGLRHQAVLAAMKGDDPQPPAGSKAVGGRPQQLPEAAQLVIDHDPQCLKRPRGRVRQSIADRDARAFFPDVVSFACHLLAPMPP